MSVLSVDFALPPAKHLAQITMARKRAAVLKCLRRFATQLNRKRNNNCVMTDLEVSAEVTPLEAKALENTEATFRRTFSSAGYQRPQVKIQTLDKHRSQVTVTFDIPQFDEDDNSTDTDTSSEEEEIVSERTRRQKKRHISLNLNWMGQSLSPPPVRPRKLTTSTKLDIRVEPTIPEFCLTSNQVKKEEPTTPEWELCDGTREKLVVIEHGKDVWHPRLDIVVRGATPQTFVLFGGTKQDQLATLQQALTYCASAGEGSEGLKEIEKQGTEFINELFPCLKPLPTIKEEDWVQPGALLDARDHNGEWYSAVVLSVVAGRARIHFQGWSHQWDEWIEKNDVIRLARSGIKCPGGRYGNSKKSFILSREKALAFDSSFDSVDSNALKWQNQ